MSILNYCAKGKPLFIAKRYLSDLSPSSLYVLNGTKVADTGCPCLSTWLMLAETRSIFFRILMLSLLPGSIIWAHHCFSLMHSLKIDTLRLQNYLLVSSIQEVALKSLVTRLWRILIAFERKYFFYSMRQKKITISFEIIESKHFEHFYLLYFIL